MFQGLQTTFLLYFFSSLVGVTEDFAHIRLGLETEEESVNFKGTVLMHKDC